MQARARERGDHSTKQQTAPHLLYVVTEDWFFASHFLPAARKAREAGYRVTVVTRAQSRGGHLQDSGLRVLPFDLRRDSFNPLISIAQVLRLARLLRRERADIVHLIALKPVLLGGLAALLARTPGMVLAVTGLGYLSVAPTLPARLTRTLVTWILGGLARFSRSRVLLENPDDAAVMRRLASNLGTRLKIVGGAGVDIDHFRALPPPKNTIPTAAIVARMLWSKGIDVAVQAQEELARRGIQLRLLLVGAPDPKNPRAISESVLNRWSSLESVRWLGHCEDVREIWQQADIALLPSRGGEGLPKCLLEAAACGRPIVTTDVPGCRTLVRHEKEGLIVPPDDAMALADALATLATDVSYRRAMGEAARQRILEGFTEDQVTDAMLALYMELCPTQPPPPGFDETGAASAVTRPDAAPELSPASTRTLGRSRA
jgi:glycosyltransferase involved in cell wall biosynthesis